jgi:hypothetical protein
VDLSVVTDNGLEMLDVVGVVLSRFGLSGGKSFRIIGMAYDLEKNICVLSLWG